MTTNDLKLENDEYLVKNVTSLSPLTFLIDDSFFDSSNQSIQDSTLLLTIDSLTEASGNVCMMISVQVIMPKPVISFNKCRAFLGPLRVIGKI